MTIYNKLVRDKIPDIMRDKGETPVIRILEDSEYVSCLEQKLDEEVREFHESKETEELADILEVVFALCESRGSSVSELMSVYRKKHDERGGFSDKIFLVGKE